MFLSYDDIKSVCNYKQDRSVVSLYIRSYPNDSIDTFRTRLDKFDDVIMREIEKYENRDKDLKYLENFGKVKAVLLLDSVRHKNQTYCVFLARDFFKIASLPIGIKERIMVDDKFYILPLLSLLGQFERYAVLLFDRRNARLFNCYMGELKEEKSVFYNYEASRFNTTTDSCKILKDKETKDRNEDSFRVHLKTISKRTAENFKEFGFDRLIIAGHKTEIESIKKYLYAHVRTRLAGEFKSDIDDHVENIKEKVLKIVADCRRKKEKEKISKLFNDSAHRKVIFGTEEVLKALGTNNVKELICANNFHTEGYICPENHFLTAEPAKGTKCDVCERELRRCAFLEDEIISKAISQRVEIFHLFYEKNKLDGHKIAALLRFKLSPRQVEEESVIYPVFSWPEIQYFS